MGGDLTLLREVVGACLEEFPRWLSDLDRGMAQNQPAVFRVAAHSICGACRTFGIERLAPPAHDLEMLAASGNLTGAGQLLEVLRPNLDVCVTELQEFLTKR